MAEPRRVIILGAAGRDFHNFNVYFRDNPAYHVVAFTATQIPGIETRKYPVSLAGNLYPEGIPIFPEEELPRLIERFGAQTCVFAYSDVDYSYIGHRIALANAHGAEFLLLGAEETMLKAKVPVIAVCAVRTGSGKSQTSRRVAGILRAHGKKVVVVRHPMPYGDLASKRSSASPRTRTWTSTRRRLRRERNTSLTSTRGPSSTPASITSKLCGKPKPRPRSSCGTEGTTTPRFSSRTFTSSSRTRCVRATSSRTIRARRTSGWRTSS